MSSNQVHPSEPNLSALEPDASVPTASHLLPARFCSLFTAQRVDSRAKLPGVAYRLQTQQRTGTATARTLHDTILNMANRHSRYQLLMNFRLHGSRFAAGLSVLFHLACIGIFIVNLALLYKETTGNNSASIGASTFCSTKCQNSGICTVFEDLPGATKGSSSSSNASSTRPPDKCSCLPGFYGDSCEMDLRSVETKYTGYTFSTQAFKLIYEHALVYMVFITACLCMLILSFMRGVQTALAIDGTGSTLPSLCFCNIWSGTIKRTQPLFGSVRYYGFASARASVDSYVAAAAAPQNIPHAVELDFGAFSHILAARYGCSVFQEQLSPTESALNAFPSASEIDVLQVMFENAPEGHPPPLPCHIHLPFFPPSPFHPPSTLPLLHTGTFMVSYKWGGWSQSVARSFFHLLPGVWLDMQNLLPGQVVTTACARAASQATVVFVFLSRNYVSRKNCM